MVSRDAVVDVLRTIDDPEMPISIVDLGIVHEVQISESGHVTVEILPTFVGCPALGVIAELIRQKVSALPGVEQVEVQHRFDPPWRAERITPAGRERLRSFGIALAEDDATLLCPFCGATEVERESRFGPTRCRMIYYCPACRNSFEQLSDAASKRR